MKIAIFYDFANFDRPKKGRINVFSEFSLHGWLELDEILPTLTTKTENSNKFCQKSASQSRKIRKNHDFHENFSLEFLLIFYVFHCKIAT